MQVRRVVTGHDASGRSVFLSDGVAPRHKDFQDIPGHGMAQIWRTGDQIVEPGGPFGSLVPGPGETSLLMVSFPPDAVMAAPVDPQRALAEMIEALPGLLETFEPDNPGMHRTATVDYAVVMDGELWLELDDGQERLLRAGDVVIQNATRHAWRNRSTAVVKVAFFMVGQHNPGS